MLIRGGFLGHWAERGVSLRFLIMIKFLRFLCHFLFVVGPAVARGVFGAGSGSRVGWRAAWGGGGFLFFGGFLLVLAGLSFRWGDWALGYHFVEFRNFPDVLSLLATCQATR